MFESLSKWSQKTAIKRTTFKNEMSISITNLFEASDEAIKNHRWSERALKNLNKIMNIYKNIKNDKLPFVCAVIFSLFIYKPSPFSLRLKILYFDENVKSINFFFRKFKYERRLLFSIIQDFLRN